MDSFAEMIMMLSKLFDIDVDSYSSEEVLFICHLLHDCISCEIMVSYLLIITINVGPYTSTLQIVSSARIQFWHLE